MLSTFRETWPNELLQMAFRSKSVRLLPNELAFLGQWQPVYRQRFSLTYAETCPSLEEKLTSGLALLDNSVFIRTNYCSWKRSLPANFVCRSLKDMLAVLRKPDERIERGLLFARANDVDVYLHLIEWRDFERLREFRIFVQERKVIGISAYHEPVVTRTQPVDDFEYVSFVARLAAKLISVLHIDTVVMDVALDIARGQGYLIELNPFSPSTDAGYFSWDHAFDMTFRCRAGVREIT